MSAERRAHPRHPITQTAQFYNDTHIPQACVIDNFCQSGLLISFEYQEADLLHSEQRPIHSGESLTVEFKSTDGKTKFQLSTQVVRILDHAMGLLITQPNPAALQQLFKLASEASVQSVIQKQHQPDLLNKIKSSTIGFLNANTSMLTQRVIDALLLHASKANTNAEEHLTFELVNKLKANPEALAKSLKSQVTKFINLWIAGKPNHFSSGQETESATTLALVEKDSFEHWLIAQILINKSMQEQGELLFQVEAGLNKVSPYPLNDKNMPMTPLALGQGFYESLKPLHLNKELTQTFFDVFDEQVLQKLDSLYQGLLETLTAAGIDTALPKPEVNNAPSSTTETIEEATESSEGTAKVTPIAEAIKPDNADTHQPNSQAYQDFHSQQVAAQEALGVVQRLLSMQHNLTASDTESSIAASDNPVMASAQVHTALNSLQSQVAQGNPELLEQSLSEQLTAVLGNEQGKLSEQDNMAVGLTENFVNSMLKQSTLTDTLKPAIKQLEIPLLKIVRQDDSFFEDDNHPARQVLNRIGQLGMKGGAMNKAQQRSIEHLVNRLTGEFDQDLNVFHEVLEGLDQLKDKQTTAVQRNTKRVVEACEGIQSVENAKQHVAELLDTHLGGKELPEAVIELIDKCWRELLVFVLLRDGKNSTQWKSYSHVVAILGQLTPDQLATEESQNRAGGLIKLIETGLKDASSNTHTVLLDRFKSTILGKPGEHDPCYVLFPKGAELEQDFETNIDAKLLEDKAFGRWLKRAKRLQVSDWLEQQEGTEATPMRLAWIAEEYAKYVFVNHHGMKVVEHSLEEVASGLQAGSLWQIAGDDVPFVDQAIDHMIQDVYCQMDCQAKHDELTGCNNRKEFERRLQHALESCKRKQNKQTVCFINLDQFKVINSTCGMTAGDQLLVDIVQVMQEQLPPYSTLARFGGDEFAVLMENCYEAKGREIAQAMLTAIQDYRFIHDEKTYTVGASIGLVVIDEEWPDIETITHCVDSALISAKEGGRNRVHVYEPHDKEQREREEVMERVAQLNQALDEERLQLRCQKIDPIDASTGIKPHYEVLLSVEDENGLYVAPGDFIHAAERYNRMQAVDRWVIRQVFKWMADCKLQLNSLGGFTINLSGHSLNDESLLSYIFDQLIEFDVPRDKICFEITETTAVASLTAAADFIAEMKTLGFRFALDDFGSGLASYRYLKGLPVDYVKIDGSFVKDITDNISDFAMVKSINELAHMMGKKTVAEYVENKEILDKLADIGVDYAQGYYVEKPRLLSEIISQAAA